MKRRQLVTYDRAANADRQPTTPCSDCPFRRTALPGWLGGHTPEQYRAIAHSDAFVECHAVKVGRKHAECIGLAVYRANVVKSAPPGTTKMAADKETIFATPQEFVEHHSRAGWDAIKRGRRRR